MLARQRNTSPSPPRSTLRTSLRLQPVWPADPMPVSCANYSIRRRPRGQPAAGVEPRQQDAEGQYQQKTDYVDHNLNDQCVTDKSENDVAQHRQQDGEAKNIQGILPAH